MRVVCSAGQSIVTSRVPGSTVRSSTGADESIAAKMPMGIIAGDLRQL
jgi:hypothetical protein